MSPTSYIISNIAFEPSRSALLYQLPFLLSIKWDLKLKKSIPDREVLIILIFYILKLLRREICSLPVSLLK